MAPPVQQHRVPRLTGQGQGGLHTLGGAAGEEEAVGHVENLCPKLLRRLDGVPAGEEVAGGGQLGEVQGGQARQLGGGEGAALVAGHVHAQGAGLGEGPQGVVQGGVFHGFTSGCGRVHGSRASQRPRASWAIRMAGRPYWKYQWRVLWRKSHMPAMAPGEPPSRATAKKVFSGTRRRFCLARRLSAPMRTKSSMLRASTQISSHFIGAPPGRRRSRPAGGWSRTTDESRW